MQTKRAQRTYQMNEAAEEQMDKKRKGKLNGAGTVQSKTQRRERNERLWRAAKCIRVKKVYKCGFTNSCTCKST